MGVVPPIRPPPEAHPDFHRAWLFHMLAITRAPIPSWQEIEERVQQMRQPRPPAPPPRPPLAIGELADAVAGWVLRFAHWCERLWDTSPGDPGPG